MTGTGGILGGRWGWLGQVLQVLFFGGMLALVFRYLPSVSWPPLVALILVLLTRNAILGLASGCLLGCALLNPGLPGLWLVVWLRDYLFGAVSGDWRVAALVFTLLLGAFAGLVELSGGFGQLLNWLHRRQATRRQVQLTTIATGVFCFFDGLANAVLLGRLYRPLYDRMGISRAKLAYLVDTTSSAVAAMAFISTWIATQLTLIQAATGGMEGAPAAYELFLRSVPFCFYCSVSLGLAICTVASGWSPGIMRRAEVQAEEEFGKLNSLGGEWDEFSEARESNGEANNLIGLWRVVLPVVGLIVAIVGGFYFWENGPVWPSSLGVIQQSFAGEAGPYALVLGAVIGCLVAWLVVPRSKRSEAGRAATVGAGGMLAPLTILIMAWAFGGILNDLGTAELLAGLLRDSVAVAYLPAAVFLTAAVTSFLTGSAWGTMSLFMPLALPIYFNLAEGVAIEGEALWVAASAVIGAVFGGAVFGDHCSPFSDTTIVSAVAAGVAPVEHVRTQLPYALIAAVLALMGYLLVAAGVGVWWVLGLILAGLICLPRGFGKLRAVMKGR